MNRKQKTIDASIAFFDSGYGCAEAVLMAAAAYKGIESDLIPRMATGFCGGLARTGGMCGAVTGGVLAINLIHGRDHASGDKEKAYQSIQEFLELFRKEFNEVDCPALAGVDLSTDEGRKEYTDREIHPKCARFVGEATRMVLEIDL